jgi:uncharacterized protein YoaH (UPF0181 family)
MMIDCALYTVNIDFGGNLELSFSLTEWEYKRFNELQNQGCSEQQAISVVKNELRKMGHIKHPTSQNY